MAVLNATRLTGCNSIPSFIAAGSRTIFNMATAPVSWTKDTGINQGTLRVVSGTAGSGGSATFSQVFQASKPFSGTLNTRSASVGVGQIFRQVTFAAANVFPTSANTGSSSLSVAQMRTHSHRLAGSTGTVQINIGTPQATTFLKVPPNFQGTLTSSSTVGSTQTHNHSIGQVPHTHATGQVAHNHVAPYSHSHTVSGQVDFNITYVDMIIASKN